MINTTSYTVTLSSYSIGADAYEPKRDTWTLFEDNVGSYTSGEYRTQHAF